MKQVNVIIVTEKGITRNPFVTSSDKKATMFYEKIVKELLGDDFNDVVKGLFDDNSYDRISNYLQFVGKDIQWYTEIEVN